MARPRNENIVRESGAQQGLSPDSTRMTFILPVDTAEKVKAYAYTKNITIKKAMTEMIETFIENYESNPENEPLLLRNRRNDQE